MYHSGLNNLFIPSNGATWYQHVLMITCYLLPILTPFLLFYSLIYSFVNSVLSGTFPRVYLDTQPFDVWLAPSYMIYTYSSVRDDHYFIITCCRFNAYLHFYFSQSEVDFHIVSLMVKCFPSRAVKYTRVTYTAISDPKVKVLYYNIPHNTHRLMIR